MNLCKSTFNWARQGRTIKMRLRGEKQEGRDREKWGRQKKRKKAKREAIDDMR
jgi:hypothetical protein